MPGGGSAQEQECGHQRGGSVCRRADWPGVFRGGDITALASTATFSTALDAAQVRERALGWFAPYTHRVEVDGSDRLLVHSGSQAKMRLLGGAFVAGSTLPARTEIRWTGDEVTITASDGAGIGSKTGMKGKYQQWLDEIVAGVQAALNGSG